MANVNQIYTMVNDAASEALGKSAITAKDTGTLVSLGDQVFSSDTNKEQFYKALTDRIGRTAIAVRAYTAKNRSVKRDEMEWGAVYQKISYKWKNSTTNPSWDAQTQADPFDVAIGTEAVQKLFSVIGTYSYEDSIPDYQLFTAFTSASAMGAYISGIYTNMANALAVADENLANLAVSTNIAGVLKKGKATQKRNLLAEYKTLSGDAEITVANALTNLNFLKYATREIKTVIDNMTTMSVLYNAEADIPRHTPTDKQVVEVLGLFASASDTYLQADTYHKEMVALPNYEKVVYWQAPGTGFAFDDVSKINIKNENIDVSPVEQGGILAFVHDVDSCASIIYRRRSHSIYNPRAERFNIFEKADKGYAVDLSENAVVFYIAE